MAIVERDAVQSAQGTTGTHNNAADDRSESCPKMPHRLQSDNALLLRVDSKGFELAQIKNLLRDADNQDIDPLDPQDSRCAEVALLAAQNGSVSNEDRPIVVTILWQEVFVLATDGSTARRIRREVNVDFSISAGKWLSVDSSYNCHRKREPITKRVDTECCKKFGQQ